MRVTAPGPSVRHTSTPFAWPVALKNTTLPTWVNSLGWDEDPPADTPTTGDATWADTGPNRESTKSVARQASRVRIGPVLPMERDNFSSEGDLRSRTVT